MKRKNDKLELILLGVGILLLLLLFVVKRRLDAPEETATAESRTETMEGKKQEETIQNMEQENAAFLNSKKEEQKETTATGPVQIRVLLTDCGKLGYAQKQVSLRGNASLSMNDGAYIASPQETICVTEQECGEVVHVVPADETAGTAVSLTGKPEDETVYPGSFVIYKSEEGLLVVNELDLEMYLRYVVPSEMPSSYEKEALKAQAVCARTYACARIREKNVGELPRGCRRQRGKPGLPQYGSAAGDRRCGGGDRRKNHHLRRGTNSGVFFLNLLREDEYG